MLYLKFQNGYMPYNYQVLKAASMLILLVFILLLLKTEIHLRSSKLKKWICLVALGLPYISYINIYTQSFHLYMTMLQCKLDSRKGNKRQLTPVHTKTSLTFPLAHKHPTNWQRAISDCSKCGVVKGHGLKLPTYGWKFKMTSEAILQSCMG